jgi:hypothetical protein
MGWIRSKCDIPDMTSSLATIFVVVWSLLASLALGFAQEFENFPDAEITSDQWQQRVQDARRRSEQFVANARTQVLEPLSTGKEEAEESDQRAMNDPSLQRGRYHFDQQRLLRLCWT